MIKKKKQTFTVTYSIIGYYEVKTKAENAEEAVDIANEIFDNDKNWAKNTSFIFDPIQVADEDGSVVTNL